MKDSNCDNVRFGVESENEEIRNTVLAKGRLANEKIINCARLLKKYKIISKHLICLEFHRNL